MSYCEPSHLHPFFQVIKSPYTLKTYFPFLSAALKSRADPQTSLNSPQSLILNVSHTLAAYSTASPISRPCLPSSRSTSSSEYSPRMCGTLMVIRISVLSFSSRMRFSTMAVKSGEGLEDLGSGGGVCVAIKV